MKSRTMILYVIVTMCALSGFAWAADNPSGRAGGGGGMVPVEQDEFSSPVGARCLLKVSCDPSILRLDDRMTKHLWFSTGVLNKAYRETLEDCNSPMGLDDGSGDISVVNGTFEEVVYSVGVSEIGGKEKEILAAAVDNLKSVLSRIENEELQKFRDRFSQTDIRCMEAETQVAEMQKQVRTIAETGIASREELQKKIGDLRNSMIDIDMKIQYSETRIKQLREQKGRIEQKMGGAPIGDSATEELKKLAYDAELLVTQCEQGLSAGRISAEKVQEAKERLARIKIELAKRIEEVREKAGQKQFADIDDQIGKTTSEISELTMSRKFKSAMYGETQQLLAKSDELELLEMKLNAAKKSFQDILAARENLKTRFQTAQRLSISVVGME